MKDILKTGAALFAITAVFTLVLALTNHFTTDVIALAREEARLASMSYVLPAAEEFSAQVTLDNAASLMGYAVGFAGGAPTGVVAQVSVTGFSPNLIFLVGIDLDGVITGLDVIAHAETPGLGSLITDEAVRHQFIGATGDVRVLTRGEAGPNEVMAIVGATITVAVVADGVNLALDYVNANVIPNIGAYSPE